MGKNGRSHAHRSHCCSELRESLREWAIRTDQGVWSFRCPWRHTSSL
jgi:hypothetical protein